MNSINDNKDAVEQFDVLMELLESALKEADAMDLAIVGIRISEALDALAAIRGG